MNKPLRNLTVMALALFLGMLVFARQAAAADSKPALTVACAGYDQVMNTLKAAGHAKLAAMAEAYLEKQTHNKGLAGLDKSRPLGAMLSVGENGDFSVLIYLPVTDLKQLFFALSPAANDKGVFEFPQGDETLYARQIGAWAVCSPKREMLDQAAADPTPLLAELTNKHLVAVRGSVQNIPATVREDRLKALCDSLKGEQMPEEEKAVVERILATLLKLARELAAVDVGMGLETPSKTLFMDLEVRALADTDTAKKFDTLKDAKTDFAGFALPGAAVSMLRCTAIDDEDVKTVKAILEFCKTSVNKSEDAGDGPGEKQRAARHKQLLLALTDVVEKTIELKKIEGGLVLLLNDGLDVAFGIRIAEGKKLEATVAELIKDNIANKQVTDDDPKPSDDGPKPPKLIPLEAETYEGVDFRGGRFPLPGPAAAKIVGSETIQLVAGVSESSLFLGAGKDAVATIKKVLAASKDAPGKAVKPFELVISGTPVAQFVAKVLPAISSDDAQIQKNVGEAAAIFATSGGKDHIRLTEKAILNGAAFRLDVESGVVRAILKLLLGIDEDESVVEDEYWPWAVHFSARIQEIRSKRAVALATLPALAVDRRNLYSRWLHLSHRQLEATPPRKDLMDKIGDFVREHAPGSRVKLPPQPAPAGPQFFAAVAQRKAECGRKINAKRFEQDKEIHDVLSQYASLLDELRSKAKAWPGRSQVEATRQQIEAEAALAKVNLYRAAEFFDRDELPKALDEAGLLGDADPGVLLTMKALSLYALAENLEQQAFLDAPAGEGPSPTVVRAFLSRADAFRAVHEAVVKSSSPRPVGQVASATRSGVSTGIGARELLLKMELNALRRAAAKLGRESNVTLLDFGDYLGKRGMQGDHPDGWPSWVHETIFVLGHGPITACSAIAFESPWFPEFLRQNVPKAQADFADAQMSEIASQQVAILVMISLNKRGVTLTEMNALTTDQAMQRLHMPEKDKRHATWLCSDIHATLGSLKDLAALVARDFPGYAEAATKAYNERIDTDQSWCEYLGDMFFSPMSVMAAEFGPAVLRVNGKWKVTGWMTGTTGLEGKLTGLTGITFGPEVATAQTVSRTLTLPLEGWAQALEGHCDTFKSLRTYLGAQAEVQSKLLAESGWRQFGFSAGKFVAVVGLTNLACYKAEEINGPVAAFLVQCLAMSGMHEVGWEILSGANRAEFLAVVEKQRLLAAEREKANGGAQQAIAAAKEVLLLPAAEPEKIEVIADNLSKTEIAQSLPDNLPVVPQDPQTGVAQALKESAAALRKNDLSEAKRALSAAEEWARQGEKVNDILKKTIEQAAANLARREPEFHNFPFANAPVQRIEAGGFEGIVEVTQTADNIDTWEKLNQGNKQFQQGNWDQARMKYVEAEESAARAGLSGDIPKAAEKNMNAVAKAAAAERVLKKLRATAPPAAAMREIPPAIVQEIGQRLDEGKIRLTTTEDSLNVICKVTDDQGSGYYLKSYKKEAGKRGIVDVTALNTELMASPLAKEIGGKVPNSVVVDLGVRTVEIVDKQGRPKLKNGNGKPMTKQVHFKGMLVRDIGGGELGKTTQEVALALKEQYALLRVLRTWLADTDGHYRQYVVGPDFNLWGIDFGMGHLEANYETPQCSSRMHKPYTSAKEFMSGVINTPSILVTHLGGGNDPSNLYNWILTMDKTLTYEDMAPALEKIKALCDNPDRLREILSQRLPAEDVDAALKALIDRGSGLDDAFKANFPSNPNPKPKVMQLRSKSNRLLAGGVDPQGLAVAA